MVVTSAVFSSWVMIPVDDTEDDDEDANTVEFVIVLVMTGNDTRVTPITINAVNRATTIITTTTDIAAMILVVGAVFRKFLSLLFLYCCHHLPW